MVQKIQCIGAASGIAASLPGTADGPLVLQKSHYFADLVTSGLEIHWSHIIKPKAYSSKLEAVTHFNQSLAASVADEVRQGEFFTVFGGDHSCAIGTWSGVSSVIGQKGTLGLIWIDAHMDSHTPDTSQSGNYHGMPLATLLGFGDSNLTSIGTIGAKLKPENLCLIGIRSYEADEEALLKKLNVRVYFMDEVKQRGLDVIIKEAIQHVSKSTHAFGITIDMDSIDPNEAPGTGVSEPDGLSAEALCKALCQVADHPKFIGSEIVEFDPHLDQNHRTEKIIPSLVSAMTLGRI